MKDQLPHGLTLRHTLRGHDFFVKEMCWSADGETLAAPCDNGTIEIWNTITGKLIRRLTIGSRGAFPVAWISDDRIVTAGSDAYTYHPLFVWTPETGMRHKLWADESQYVSQRVFCLAWSRVRNSLAIAVEGRILLWNARTGRIDGLTTLSNAITSLVWSPDGKRLASACRASQAQSDNAERGAITIWDPSTHESWRLLGHTGSVNGLAWSPDSLTMASASDDQTIRIWDLQKGEGGQHSFTVEGHTGPISSVSFSYDGNLLVSKSEDKSVRLWRSDTWETVARFEEPFYLFAGVAFHPTAPVLTTLGRGGKAVRVWDLDQNVLISRPISKSGRYANAKVVLVGDTGVGKSGLGLVLSGQPFIPTESTHGRRVWTLQTTEVPAEDGRLEVREVLLWDLAGQPGYRLIHQLHLNEVTVALVVFDARDDVDPLAGVRHWDRALRQAKSVQGDPAVHMAKFLVAARIDRGGISVSRGRLELFLHNLQFDDYFETSAREGWKISELQEAICKAIDWDSLPKVSSTDLFKRMKDFIIKEKESAWLLSTVEDLYRAFLRSAQDSYYDDDLRAQFNTCIGRLESRDIIQRLSFGSLILLQPEMLDAYASAIVNASKSEPDGLGCIAEESAREGRFPISQDERIQNQEEERLLLIATIEDLLRHEIALREHTDQGPQLVFPSQLTRENPDLPEPEGRSVVFSFEGPLLNIYATLVVRLSHSGIFRRRDMWKNASTYWGRIAGTCGIFLRQLEEGRGELALFFDSEASEETRFQFEEYIRTHLLRRALPDTIERRRVFACSKCGELITDKQVERRRERGFGSINCPVCETNILLLDREDRLPKASPSVIGEMDRAANARRELDAGLVAAAGEMQTQGFRDWAGSAQTTLALVFTDVVDSTKLGVVLGNEEMSELRRTHFRQGRHFLAKYNGYEIKTIGDSFMVAFRTALAALDFALAFGRNTGDDRIKIRAGIHVGPVRIEEEDAFGTMVNFTNRVANMTKEPELWLSSAAKTDIDQERAKRHAALIWHRYPDCEIRGFSEKQTLWAIRST